MLEALKGPVRIIIYLLVEASGLAMCYELTLRGSLLTSETSVQTCILFGNGHEYSTS